MSRRREPRQAQLLQQLRKAELLQRMRAAQAARGAARLAEQPLDAGQRAALSMAHHVNLDAICSGKAEPTMLWDFIGGVLCWWKAAQLLQAGVPEMDVQLEVAARLCERWSRTGRVLFDGPDMQLARDGVVVMDLLASEVDLITATTAAEWSEREINRMAQAVALLKQQEARAA